MPTLVNILLAVAILPLLLSFVGGYFRNKQFGNADNNNPREQASGLTGAGARCYSAQQNAWEALGFFTAALLAANMLNVAAEAMLLPAYIFLGCRVLHAILYLADIAALRSLVWIIGTGACIWIFRLGFGG